MLIVQPVFRDVGVCHKLKNSVSRKTLLPFQWLS
jgi:hypothetical protein